MRVVGVDGCPGGWVAVTWDTVDRTLEARVHPTFGDVLDVYQDAAALGVDIPIGLGEGEPRQCDLAARKAISPRGSCVFPAPDARLVEALIQANVSVHDFRFALGLARELTDKGMSKQAFNIWPKITEVNLTMTPKLQQHIVEVHPEVSFWAMAGKQPMQHKKRRQAGYDERAVCLKKSLARPSGRAKKPSRSPAPRNPTIYSTPQSPLGRPAVLQKTTQSAYRLILPLTGGV